VLKEYHHKIEDAISDLKDRLRRVDDIQVLLAQGSNDVNGVEWRNIQAEKESIQKCLDICRGVSSHIDSVRPTVIENILTDPGGHYIDVFTSGAGASAQRRTKEALDRCKDDLAGLLPELASRLEEVSHRQQALAQASTVSANQRTEQARLQEEIESIKQSLKICTQAAKKAHPERTNVFEEVSLTDDGHQLVISTIGDLISAKKVSVGARSHQWLGQMSDESLQQLSRDRDPSSPERIPRLGGGSPQFENTYGRGRKM
jgi:hypothetical protein